MSPSPSESSSADPPDLQAGEHCLRESRVPVDVHPETSVRHAPAREPVRAAGRTPSARPADQEHHPTHRVADHELWPGVLAGTRELQRRLRAENEIALRTLATDEVPRPERFLFAREVPTVPNSDHPAPEVENEKVGLRMRPSPVLDGAPVEPGITLDECAAFEKVTRASSMEDAEIPSAALTASFKS